MERNKNSLWHRCGTCGTVFLSVQELRAHAKSHQGGRDLPRREAEKRPVGLLEEPAPGLERAS